MTDLTTLGWTPAFQEAFDAFARDTPGLVPGRVVREHTHIYGVLTGGGECLAQVAGRLRHRAEGRTDFPAVGDWVALKPGVERDRATIHAVLPRFSRFARKVAGETTEEQVVAANINTVFLVAGLDGDFNLRRLERYLVLVWESGATPVMVLNKADVCDAVAARMEEVCGLAAGVPVHAVCAKTGAGFDDLRAYLRPGETVGLLGSSGVGKTTIVNALAGEERGRTREVRAYRSRGRHTTTNRELVVLPGGGLIVDTPGMREIQLWVSGDARPAAFDDVEALAVDCFFRDCQHGDEPRCAVKQAVADGRLPADRLANHQKMKAELRHLEIKQDVRAQLEQKRRWRVVHKAARDFKPRE